MVKQLFMVIPTNNPLKANRFEGKNKYSHRIKANQHKLNEG
jgi:hypothetical protein